MDPRNGLVTAKPHVQVPVEDENVDDGTADTLKLYSWEMTRSQFVQKVANRKFGMYELPETISEYMEDQTLQDQVFADLAAYLKSVDFTHYDRERFSKDNVIPATNVIPAD